MDEGDVIQPLVLVIPLLEGDEAGKYGQLKMSGSKLHVYLSGSDIWEKVTSA